jgi:hypothetical protein
MPTSEHVYEQDFDCYPLGFLENGKDLAQKIRLSELKRCVGNLSKSDDGLRERTLPSTKHTTYGGREKRSEPRFVTNDSGFLQILNPFSDNMCRVRILDVSKNGLGLRLPTAALPGSEVKVGMKDYLAFGNIRYCVQTAEGFLVGIQIHDFISCRTADEVTENIRRPRLNKEQIA